MTTTAALLLFSLAAIAPISHISKPDYFPFGVSQGQSPSSLGCHPVTVASMDATGQYVCRSLPVGDPIFEEYIIAYVRGLGICNVVGITPYGGGDSNGSHVRRLFDKVRRAMSQKLGIPDEDVDHAVTPQAGNEGNFRSAIISGERQIFAQWGSFGQRFRNLQSASAAISGDEEYGMAVYEIYRFFGNDSCLRQMEQVTGLSADE